MDIISCIGSRADRPTSTTWSFSGACCLTRTGWRQYRRPQFSLTSQQEVAPLMGSKAVEPKLYLSFSLDAAVPANHIVRRLAAAVDFGFVRNLTKQHYSHTGQPSVDPVVLFKLWLLGYLFNIRSERRLCEEACLNLAWRWLQGYELDVALFAGEHDRPRRGDRNPAQRALATGLQDPGCGRRRQGQHHHRSRGRRRR